MGVDIHMHIIDKNGNFIKKDIYNDRNYALFDGLTKNSNDKIYNFLEIKSGIPNESPKDLKKVYKERNINFYYDFFYIKIEDFYNWIESKRPK